MATVFDVAAFILRERGPMSAMKLQKLVYYCQAWSLVWDGRPMFDNALEAWANGPVAPDLYAAHRGQFMVSSIPGDAELLDQDARDTVEAVLDYYAGRSPQWLSDLTHMERPWVQARGQCPVGARCSSVISLESMAEYYEALPLSE